MLKLSLMTINMMMPIWMKIVMEQDLEEALELYNEMMDLVVASGYEAVDVTSMEMDLLGVDSVMNVLRKRNLKVSSLIHFGKFTAMDEAECIEVVEKAKKAIDLALNFETNVVMLVPQPQDNILDYTRVSLADQLAKNWTPVAQYAKENGVHLVIEDTPDLRIPLCTTEELQYVLDRVPALEVVYDSGNMILVDEDPVKYFDVFASKTGYIHLKDMQLADKTVMFADTAKDGRKMTAAPSGKGMVDFCTLLKHIKESGYDGYLTVEFAKNEQQDYLESLVNAREYFERLLAV